MNYNVPGRLALAAWDERTASKDWNPSLMRLPERGYGTVTEAPKIV